MVKTPESLLHLKQIIPQICSLGLFGKKKKKAYSIGNPFYWPESVIFGFLKQLEGL